MMNKVRTARERAEVRDDAGFSRAPLARIAEGMARAAGGAAHRAIPGTRRGAGRLHARRPRHPRGSRLRQDRRDAPGHRPVHDAPPDGGVRRPRFVPPPRGRRGFRDRGHPRCRAHRSGGGGLRAVRPAGRAGGPADRRDAARGPAGPAQLPGQLPVPYRAGRLPDRRRHPGGGRAVAGHARGQRRGQPDRGQAHEHRPRAPARALGRRGSVDRGHCGRARGSLDQPLDQPPDPGPADRGDHRDHRELGRGPGRPRRGRGRARPARAAQPGAARPRLARRHGAARCRGGDVRGHPGAERGHLPRLRRQVRGAVQRGHRSGRPGRPPTPPPRSPARSWSTAARPKRR